VGGSLWGMRCSVGGRTLIHEREVEVQDAQDRGRWVWRGEPRAEGEKRRGCADPQNDERATGLEVVVSCSLVESDCRLHVGSREEEAVGVGRGVSARIRSHHK
jgi:hypothetical protein